MGKRQEIRERRKKAKQRQRMILVMVISGIALIFGALLIAPTLNKGGTQVGDYVIPDFTPHPNANANTMGDPNAPVLIEEFSDFGCGHCANFAETKINQIIDEYIKTGKVYFVYHSVGGLLGSPVTPLAAEAAYCAGDQNRFWDFHNVIFANQTLLFFTDPATDINKYFKSFAKDLGLNMDEFQACLDGGKYKEKVAGDEVAAQKAEVDGTPTFLINGDVLKGDQPIEKFREVIDAKLKEKE